MQIIKVFLLILGCLSFSAQAQTGKFVGIKYYDSDATYAPSPGVTSALIIVTGGGGAGGSSGYGNTYTQGQTGGTTSVGDLVVASGGEGGLGPIRGGKGGKGLKGTALIDGSGGGCGSTTNKSIWANSSGRGGSSFWGGGAETTSSKTNGRDGGNGGGASGGGGDASREVASACGGGSGGTAIAYVKDLHGSYPVKIAEAAMPGSAGVNGYIGGIAGRGRILILEFT